MTFATFASGIEAASVAWKPLGWKARYFSEISPWKSALLAQRYPGVPNIGDMLQAHENETFTKTPVDLIAAGTPCTDWSIAGAGAGLDGSNARLTLTFLRLLAIARPKWVVWENVPKVLTHRGGADFAAILQGFRQCGYSCAWRVLDAKYFGVPQRRRRIFIVGHLGNDWRPSAAVLLERASLSGHPAPSRKTGQGFTHDTAYCLTASSSCNNGTAIDGMPNLVADVAGTLCNGGRSAGSVTNQDIDQGNLIPFIFDPTQITSPQNQSAGSAELCHTLANNQHTAIVANTLTSSLHKSGGAVAGNNVGLVNPVLTTYGVRRLTPREYERLQGFPDDYTLIQYRGRPAADGPRYQALGDSWAVPVARWIGERIQMVDNLIYQ